MKNKKKEEGTVKNKTQKVKRHNEKNRNKKDRKKLKYNFLGAPKGKIK